MCNHGRSSHHGVCHVPSPWHIWFNVAAVNDGARALSVHEAVAMAPMWVFSIGRDTRRAPHSSSSRWFSPAESDVGGGARAAEASSGSHTSRLEWVSCSLAVPLSREDQLFQSTKPLRPWQRVARRDGHFRLMHEEWSHDFFQQLCFLSRQIIASHEILKAAHVVLSNMLVLITAQPLEPQVVEYGSCLPISAPTS